MVRCGELLGKVIWGPARTYVAGVNMKMCRASCVDMEGEHT